ncbi:MAG: hypothetical protein V1729_05860 [Candidatus Woesearchaeota archaeon]
MGLLASNAYGQGDEKDATRPDAITGAISSVSDSVSFEQLMRSTEEAAWKIAAEPYSEPELSVTPGHLRPEEKVPQAQRIPQWDIEGTRGGAMGDAFYSIPRDFHLELGGKYGMLKGHGFTWEAGEEELYYKGYPILKNFESLQGKRYDESITLGGKTLADFLETYEDERPGIETALDNNLAVLQSQLMGIFQEKYEQRFVLELFIHLLGVLPEYGRDDGQLTIDEYVPLGKDLEEFARQFYDENVSEEDKRRTQEAMNAFAKNMFESYKDTDTYDTLRTVGQDPDNNIKLGSMTLGDLERLAEGFGDVIGAKVTPDGIKGSRTIRGRGVAHAELSMTSDVNAGDQSGEFNHSILSDNRVDAMAYADLDLRLRKGAPVYIYVADKGLKISLEQFGKLAGFDFNLIDVELDADMGYMYHLRSRFAESFELSEPTAKGRQGVGMTYDRERSSFERADVDIYGKLDTAEKSLVGRVHNRWEQIYKEHELMTLYLFNQEVTHKMWYYAAAGIQGGEEITAWQSMEAEQTMRLVLGKEEEMTDTQDHYSDYDKKFLFRPRINIAAGFRHKLLSPFFAYTQLPQETLRLGMLLDIPHVPSRIYVRATPDDFAPKNPMADDKDMSAEASVVLLDDEGNRKVIDYYIQDELFQASPRVGKGMDQQMLKAALYSDIDGIILTARAIDENLSFQGVWGADSPFFVGMGYFGNVLENFHGGNLIIGYDEFALDAGFGALSKGDNHGHAIRASAAGRIDDVVVYLGINGVLPTSMPEESIDDYGSLKPALDATVNISGFFDERTFLNLLSPGWWRKKISD